MVVNKLQFYIFHDKPGHLLAKVVPEGLSLSGWTAEISKLLKESHSEPREGPLEPAAPDDFCRGPPPPSQRHPNSSAPTLSSVTPEQCFLLLR
ncbi:hypothetical protein CDAR_66471 [Caerostris darwini]|uniref:Uncharacterized protein n=1 Tax=Caerostris darwini TaxID=1538125 RepID=A0AAV4UJB5_9ARAC|nr:hypothetical protein CDAR_66471 [Caerostris darwini]